MKQKKTLPLVELDRTEIIAWMRESLAGNWVRFSADTRVDWWHRVEVNNYRKPWPPGSRFATRKTEKSIFLFEQEEDAVAFAARFA